MPFPSTAGGVQHGRRLQGIGQGRSPEEPPGPLSVLPTFYLVMGERVTFARRK